MQRLSHAEEIVMSVIWFYDGIATTSKPVKDVTNPDLFSITERLQTNYGKEWKIQTIATFLTRLAKKGYVSTYRVGRYSHYKPIVTLNEYREQKLKDTADLLFQNDMKQLISFANLM